MKLIKKTSCMKKMIIIFVIMLSVALLPSIVLADDNSMSGNCGRLMTYSYDSNTCILTLSGGGIPYQDFRFSDEVRINTKKIEFVDYYSETLPNIWGFTSLYEFVSPESMTHFIYGGPFSNCSSLKKVTLPNSIRSISNDFFNGCDNLETVIIPDSVETFVTEAFYNWTGLKHIVISERANIIPYMCFGECINLEEITLMGSKQIDGHAFYHCEKLKRIEIPMGSTIIGTNAFSYCSDLEEILIPNSVYDICYDAFEHCDKITIVGAEGSYAEEFARKTGIPFQIHKQHIWDETYTIDKEATATETGLKSIHCSACGQIKEGSQQIIPALNDPENPDNPDKPENLLMVKATTKTVKAKTLKKKSLKVKPITVKNALGTVSYNRVGGNAKSKKALTINTKTGTVTVKRKTKKGTYKIRVDVVASGYKESKSVWVTVRVK